MSIEKDRLELDAWYEWKKWCSILRVYSPQPMEDEIAVGKVDNIPLEKRKKLYNILRQRVCSCLNKTNDNFSEPANTDIDDQYCDSEQSSFEDDSEARQEKKNNKPPWFGDPYVTFISCFDEFMKSEKKKKNEDFINSGGTSYKDYVFYCVANSEDETLKVIRGKITSPNGGYILAVLELYFRENHCVADLCPSSKFDHSILRDIVELDAPIDENNSESLTYEALVATKELVKTEDADIADICNQLTKVEKILFLAVQYHLSLANTPAISQFAGLEKTTLYKHRNDLFDVDGKLCKILREFPQNYDMLDLRRRLTEQIKISLLAEKDAKAFLALCGTQEAN